MIDSIGLILVSGSPGAVDPWLAEAKTASKASAKGLPRLSPGSDGVVFGGEFGRVGRKEGGRRDRNSRAGEPAGTAWPVRKLEIAREMTG